jgi:hypothetical protein
MRTKFFLFPFFALLAFTATAQREETVLGHRGFRFSGIWGGSNHQITRFGNTNSYMNGGFFGLEFGKSLTVGFSGYELEENVSWDQLADQPFKMRFRGLNLGYGISSYRAIHPTFNLDLAPGRVELRQNGETLRDRIFVVQPAAGIEINVLRWFHLGLQGGYRFVTDTNIASLSDKNLSGAFGQATLKFGWSWGRSRRMNTGNN